MDSLVLNGEVSEIVDVYVYENGDQRATRIVVVGASVAVVGESESVDCGEDLQGRWS